MTQRACETIRGMLSAFIDGDVPPAERREVEDHLRGCVDCGAEARAMRETFDALRRLPHAEPPPDLVARIDRAMGAKGSRRAGGRTRIRRHAVAMILAVAIVAGIIRVIPEGPRSLVTREPVPAASPSVVMEQSAPREVEEVAPIAERDRAALRGESAAPPAIREENPPASAEGRKDPAKERSGDALDLLRSPRPDAAWAGSVRVLVNERPGDLLAAWKSLTPKERLDVLAHWKRAATAPGIAGDLDRAMERAEDPDLRFILHALREFTP